MSDEKNSKNADRRKIELRAISEWIGDNQSVLDLGCGRGILLEELMRAKKGIYAVGVDSDFDKISHCIKRGVNAYHGDILDALSGFQDKFFDWTICSRTLPELENARQVVIEALRVGKRAAVGFVNHAYWRNRLAFATTGDRIVNEVFPDSWDKARPMNAISINSFKNFCRRNDIKIIRTRYLRGDWKSECNFMPNIFAGYAVFEISKQ